GSPAKYSAYLEDYANFIDALTWLYHATFNPEWIAHAGAFLDFMSAFFTDVKTGGFFFTADNHESLIARTKDSHDGSTPSGNAMAATGMLRLSVLRSFDPFRSEAERTLKAFAGMMNESPAALGQMLTALDFYLAPTTEIATVGSIETAKPLIEA